MLEQPSNKQCFWQVQCSKTLCRNCMNYYRILSLKNKHSNLFSMWSAECSFPNILDYKQNKHCSDVSETSFVVFGKCHCSGKTDILHPEKTFYIFWERICVMLQIFLLWKLYFLFSWCLSGETKLQFYHNMTQKIIKNIFPPHTILYCRSKDW